MLLLGQFEEEPSSLLTPPGLNEGGKAARRPLRWLKMPASLWRRVSLPKGLWDSAVELPSAMWIFESLLLAHCLAARLLPPHNMGG
jgi:hypothetical protein